MRNARISLIVVLFFLLFSVSLDNINNINVSSYPLPFRLRNPFSNYYPSLILYINYCRIIYSEFRGFRYNSHSLT
jgi:hypothetical protein